MSYLANDETNTPANRITPFTDRVLMMDLPADNPEAASMISLEWIHKLVEQGASDSLVRETAHRIVSERRVRPGDAMGVIHAVHNWVQAHVRYRFDPENVEMLTEARVMLLQIRHEGITEEDCDGMIILESALLQALGVQTKSVIIKADKRAPGQWSHIFMQAWNGKQWITLDPIMNGEGPRPKQPVGWHPPKYYERREVTQLSGHAWRGRMPTPRVNPGPASRDGFLPRTGMAAYHLRGI
jgi:hypothetical protein